MRSDIANIALSRTKLGREASRRTRYGGNPPPSSGAELSTDAVDAAFDEVSLTQEQSACCPQNDESKEKGEARDFLLTLEHQLQRLEAQCLQLKRLLDTSKR